MAICRVHVNGAGATRNGRGVVCCQSAEGDSRPQGLAPVCVQTRQISPKKFTASRATSLRNLGRARWRRAEPCGRPDAVRSCCAPPPAIRSSATKSLPCRVAAGLPIACLLMTTHSEDHSDFSSISRSRTPNADHCGFGLLFHLLSNPTGLPACRMLTPNLPTTMEIRLTGQAALQLETEARQQSRKLSTCMM